MYGTQSVSKMLCYYQWPQTSKVSDIFWNTLVSLKQRRALDLHIASSKKKNRICFDNFWIIFTFTFQYTQCTQLKLLKSKKRRIWTLILGFFFVYCFAQLCNSMHLILLFNFLYGIHAKTEEHVSHAYKGSWSTSFLQIAQVLDSSLHNISQCLWKRWPHSRRTASLFIFSKQIPHLLLLASFFICFFI